MAEPVLIIRGGGSFSDVSPHLGLRARFKHSPRYRGMNLKIRCVIFQSGADDRVNRGGSWLYGDAANLAARARFGHASSYRDLDLGFRCVSGEVK